MLLLHSFTNTLASFPCGVVLFIWIIFMTFLRAKENSHYFFFAINSPSQSKITTNLQNTHSCWRKSTCIKTHQRIWEHLFKKLLWFYVLLILWTLGWPIYFQISHFRPRCTMHNTYFTALTFEISSKSSIFTLLKNPIF